MGRVVASRRGLARGLGLLVAALTLLAVVPTGAQAASSSEFVADINAARTSRGGHALTVKGDLTAAAQAQAERMADKSELYHNPNLGGSVSNWTMLAENVGYGPDVATIHAAFMASPGHRANILNAKYTEVGVGVVVRDHVMWVAEVFRRPAGASSGSGSGSGSGRVVGLGVVGIEEAAVHRLLLAPAPRRSTAVAAAKAPRKHTAKPIAKPVAAPRPWSSRRPRCTRTSPACPAPSPPRSASRSAAAATHRREPAARRGSRPRRSSR